MSDTKEFPVPTGEIGPNTKVGLGIAVSVVVVVLGFVIPYAIGKGAQDTKAEGVEARVTKMEGAVKAVAKQGVDDAAAVSKAVREGFRDIRAGQAALAVDVAKVQKDTEHMRGLLDKHMDGHPGSITAVIELLRVEIRDLRQRLEEHSKGDGHPVAVAKINKLEAQVDEVLRTRFSQADGHARDAVIERQLNDFRERLRDIEKSIP